METKVCKICGEEKPINEFSKSGTKNNIQLYKSQCKVCNIMSKNDLVIKDGWLRKEYEIIVDNLLNKKVECINDIITYLTNKTLVDLIDLLQNNLKLYSTEIKVRVVCDNCGNKFYKTIYEYLRTKNNFCSKYCYDEHQNEKIEMECFCCGKTIYVPPFKLKSNKHFFCSQECDKKYKSENKIIKEECWTEAECSFCRSKYKILKSDLSRNERKFCSQECFKNWQKEKYITYRCDYCGKENKIRPSSYQKEASLHFCNVDCRINYNKEKAKENLITYNCDTCEKECQEDSYSYNLSKNHFCSPECFHVFLRNDYNCEEGYSKCSTCEQEKPISEFVKYKSKDTYSYFRCKVCDFFKRNNVEVVENWTLEEYKIILDNLLNKKVETVNDLIPLLNNKSLKDIAVLLRDNLKIKGSCSISIEVYCMNCGKSKKVKIHKYLDEVQLNHFCSIKCNTSYYGRKRSEDKEVYFFKCKQCGKKYEVSVSNINSGKRLSYCSPECSAESQRLKFRGKNNPNYKGGISQLYEYLRRGLLTWKKDSMENCNYICVLTGIRFDAIHHLYSFEQIVAETLLETGIECKEFIEEYSQEELLNLYNKCLEIHYRYPLGVCLTNELHELFHSLYSNKYNTPEQFEEFKQMYFNGELDDFIAC